MSVDQKLERNNINLKLGINKEVNDAIIRLYNYLVPNKIYVIKLAKRFEPERYKFLKWFGIENDLMLFQKVNSGVKESFSVTDILVEGIKIREEV